MNANNNEIIPLSVSLPPEIGLPSYHYLYPSDPNLIACIKINKKGESKTVRFSDNVKCEYIQREERMANFNNFIRESSLISQKHGHLASLINHFTRHYIWERDSAIYDDPIKVINVEKNWSEDDSPIILYRYLYHDPIYRQRFLNVYNEMIQQFLPKNTSGYVIFQFDEYIIKVYDVESR
jgi:hypothetical protein